MLPAEKFTRNLGIVVPQIEARIAELGYEDKEMFLAPIWRMDEPVLKNSL